MEQKISIDIHVGDIHSSGSKGNYVEISVRDAASGVEFLEIPLSYEEFGRLVKSSGTLSVQATVRGADVIGKKRITEPRKITIPLQGADRTVDYENWLRDQYKEPGWTRARTSALAVASSGATRPKESN